MTNRLSSLIPDEEIELRHSKFPGGQHVGVPTGMWIEHLPTGVMMYADFGRNQYKTRQFLIEMLEAAVTHPLCPNKS